MNDHPLACCHLLVKTNIEILMWIYAARSAMEIRHICLEMPVWKRAIASPRGSTAASLLKNTSSSVTVNPNHHWCYLFSNVPRLTGDILFCARPTGPCVCVCRVWLTPKQREVARDMFGNLSQSQTHMRTEVVYTPTDLSRWLLQLSMFAAVRLRSPVEMRPWLDWKDVKV